MERKSRYRDEEIKLPERHSPTQAVERVLEILKNRPDLENAAEWSFWVSQGQLTFNYVGLETDEELAERKAEERKRAEDEERNERHELARLLRKYPNADAAGGK